MNIIAYLNPNEGGCDYSKHFKEQWIDNDKLHPEVKAIPVEVSNYSAGEPTIYLYKNSSDQSPLLILKGNKIDPAFLQEYIMNALSIKTR